MRHLTLPEVASAMQARILGEVTVPRVASVSSDSRHVAPEALFFALRGENHDGHAFVDSALRRGAAAAVVSDPSDVAAEFRECGRLLLVENTTSALGRLAAWYRRQFAAQVVAVVGSNGKTTTKDLIATVLSHAHRGRAAPSSFNNHIGVPLTLLSVEPADEFVVVEIGTNHPGEIAALGRMVRPDMTVITSIGEEHLEFFGGLDGVAKEEFSILDAMSGRAFVAFSEQAAAYRPSAIRRDVQFVTYGLGDDADIRASRLECDPAGTTFLVNDRFPYRLPVLGRHNVVNALAAVAVGTRLRVSHEAVAAALRGASLPPMRLQCSEVGGMTLINDAYNANPSSMRAAFEVLDDLRVAGRKVLILGDMRELGEQALRCHQAVGREAGRSSARLILAVGAFARVLADGAISTGGDSKRVYPFPSVEAVAEKLPELLEPGDVVLIKGSRAMRLERLVDAMVQVGRTAPA